MIRLLLPVSSAAGSKEYHHRYIAMHRCITESIPERKALILWVFFSPEQFVSWPDLLNRFLLRCNSILPSAILTKKSPIWLAGKNFI
jgi:hypothetical protein